MKIKLLSDLHLEGRQGYQNRQNIWAQYNQEDVLVLAGDIAVGAKAVAAALDYFIKQGFEQIVYVPGNHEYYNHDYDVEHTAIKQVAKDRGVHFLDASEIVKIQDVSFFGGTLWTSFGHDPIAEITARKCVYDFDCVSNWNTNKCSKENIRQTDFIKTAIRQTEGKKCVVTHFLPAMQCVAERYKSDGVEFLLNKYFANELDYYLETVSDVTWLFGHTHDAMDIYRGDTRLISNPLGYPRENIPDFAVFNPTKVIEL